MITLSHVANASAQGVQVRCFVPSHLQVCNLSSSSTLHPQLFDSRKSFIMRSYKISPVTPLECADPKTPRRNSFRMRSYKKARGEGYVFPIFQFQFSSFQLRGWPQTPILSEESLGLSGTANGEL